VVLFIYLIFLNRDAYEAGCVPIYMGAPNVIADFAPSKDSLILVHDYVKDLNNENEIIGLANVIKKALTDKATFDGYMAWRKRPFDHLNKGYHNILKISNHPLHTRCQMCQILDRDKNKGS
jgi:hypothetical protein